MAIPLFAISAQNIFAVNILAENASATVAFVSRSLSCAELKRFGLLPVKVQAAGLCLSFG